MKKTVLLFVIILVQHFGPSVALAAQTAKVVVDFANVYDKPQTDATVVGTVKKDTSLAVSNTPTNGFYKSRIPSGVVGWVSGNDILAGAPAQTAAVPQAAADTQGSPSVESDKKKKDTTSVSDHSRVIIAGGLQILNNGGFPTGMSNTNSKSGYGGTFEMQFKITDSFYWGGRAEYFLSSSSQAVTTTKNQTISFHTLPLMVGLMYVPISSPKFRLGVGAYGGVSLMTSMTVVQSTSLASATVTYTSSDICEYANLQSSYKVSSKMAVLGELGYRLHGASYPASTSLGVSSFKADFGGLVARLGVEFRL